MEVTYKTQGIILQREQYGENDSRVFVYTPNFGKLELVARGTQKLSSKLSAHLEPLNLCEIMVVRGKQYDYLGVAISEEVFAGIKNDYGKTAAAGEILKLVNEVTKEKQAEQAIFLLLKEFLNALDAETRHGASLFDVLKSTFTLKFLALLGYAPQLERCVVCQRQLQPGGNSFSYITGGVVCSGCRKGERALSDAAINTMRLMLTAPLSTLADANIKENFTVEATAVIKEMRLYHLT